MSTKTSIKRIALVAVSALGFGLVTTVAPVSAAAVTASVTPVSVSYTGTALDDAPYAKISWTSTAAMTSSDTVVVALTSAPTTSAVVDLIANTSIGASRGTTIGFGGVGAGNDSLAGTGTSQAYGGADVAAGGTASLGIQADVAGYYAGTITTTTATGGAGSANDTVSFSFTTRGKAVSYTATVSAASVAVSGTSTLTVTLLDSAGNTTQPGMFDSFAIADGTSAGTFAGGATSLTRATAADPLATNLYDGTAAIVYTAPATTNTVSTLTVTPAGTLGSLAAQSLTVTTDATTVDNTAISQWVLTAPTDAAVATGTLAAGTRAQAVRTGTSVITAKATTSTAAGTVLRFKAVASAGTVDGVSYLTAQYKNVTVAAGSASVSFTLGGNALLAGATLTISQVDVANTAVALTNIVVTQTNAAANADTVTTDLGANLVRALGTSTSIKVSIEDQFGTALGAGWTVQSFRGSTLLSTATTNSAGEATVTVSPLSTVVAGGAETYSYKASYPGVTQITATETTAITYTTSGGITSMSTAIATQTGAGILTPVLHTTAATALTKLPAILVPTSGAISDQTGAALYTTTTGVLTAGATSDSIQLTNTNVPANSTTYTADAGAFICDASDCDVADGVSSLVVSSTDSAYVFARTTGVHTVTITSGDKTTTVKFYAYNAETDYYTLSAIADSASITTGQTGVVTVTVKDIFGNTVDTTGNLLTATAAGKVRLAGQALTQTVDTGIDGTFSFTVLADATAGSGTITIAPTTTGANAWASAYETLDGFSAPVKSVTLTFTVTGATLKTTDDAVAAAVAAEVEAKKATTEAAAATAAAKEATAAATKAANDAVAAAKAAGDAAVAAAVKAALDAVAASKAAQDAAVAEAQAATEAAAESIDAANAATDAANIAAEAADAATVAAEEARDAADAATAAVEELATQVSTLFAGLKAQLTTLANTVAKIAKKVRA